MTPIYLNPNPARIEGESHQEQERRITTRLPPVEGKAHDPTALLKDADTVKRQQAYLELYGSRDQAETIEVQRSGDALAPAGGEDRMGAVYPYLIALFLGGIVALIGAIFSWYTVWAIATVVAIVGFLGGKAQYDYNLAKGPSRSHHAKLPLDKLESSDEGQAPHRPYYLLMVIGAVVAGVSTLLSFYLGWFIGSLLFVVGVVVATKERSEVTKKTLEWAQRQGLNRGEDRLVESPLDTSSSASDSHPMHWLFVLGALIGLLSAVTSFYPGFITGALLACISILNDSSW